MSYFTRHQEFRVSLCNPPAHTKVLNNTGVLRSRRLGTEASMRAMVHTVRSNAEELLGQPQVSLMIRSPASGVLTRTLSPKAEYAAISKFFCVGSERRVRLHTS